MSSNSQTSVAEEEAKPVRVPKLRFSEFRGTEGWNEKPLLISNKTPQNAGAALGMLGSPLQLSGAADAVSSD
jgi:hypothetical protein